MLESRLLTALRTLDPSRPVVVEAESSKIGDRMVPPSVWRAMQAAPRVEIVAPRDARARYLVSAYTDIIADSARLEAAFADLPVQPSPARLETWRRLIAEGDFETLAAALMELHYDPAYARGRRKDGRPAMAQIHVEALDDTTQSGIADQLAQLLATL